MDDRLYRMLHNGVVRVTFRKVDGSIREMPCTLNSGLIPAQKMPKGDSTVNRSSDIIRVFAMDKSDWRSFRESSIMSYTDGLTSVELSYVGDFDEPKEGKAAPSHRRIQGA